MKVAGYRSGIVRRFAVIAAMGIAGAGLSLGAEAVEAEPAGIVAMAPMATDVFFEAGAVTLTPGAVELVHMIVDSAVAEKVTKLTVVGHSDASDLPLQPGKTAKAIGLLRAQAVLAEMRKAGLTKSAQVTVTSVGTDQPRTQKEVDDSGFDEAPLNRYVTIGWN